MSNDYEKIRITWDDVEKAEVITPIPVSRPDQTGGDGSWGSISPQPNAFTAVATSESLWLKGWFYLGVAGFLGAFLAWAFCEPSFEDGPYKGWGNTMMFPLMAILMCVSLGIVESLVERSWHRAFLRGLAAAGLGLVLGFILWFIASIIFNLLLRTMIGNPRITSIPMTNPLLWICRAFAWASFGVAGGLIFGIVEKSSKKTTYGMLGGALGAALGGLLFDPICLLTNGGEASRAIGMSILGAGTGIAIGLVESALKERWLYVSGGPLAGKQFVLYQDIVTIGKRQANTIYLFKDPTIFEQHATIEHRAGKSLLTASGPVVVAGQVLQAGMRHTLRNGDILQIGRYTFSYAEKERTTKT